MSSKDLFLFSEGIRAGLSPGEKITF